MEWDLGQWLNTQIGLEEPIVRRRNLFAKLKRLYEKHGLVVLRIIASAWEFSLARAAKPKLRRCFCRVVKLRLQEAKLWDEEKKWDAMDLNGILKSGIFKEIADLPLYEGPRGLDTFFAGNAEPNRPGHHPKCRRENCAGCA